MRRANAINFPSAESDGRVSSAVVAVTGLGFPAAAPVAGFSGISQMLSDATALVKATSPSGNTQGEASRAAPTVTILSHFGRNQHRRVQSTPAVGAARDVAANAPARARTLRRVRWS